MILKNELLNIIKNSNYPVAFTGAGISLLSGTSTFDKKILGYELHDVFSIDFFLNNLFEFYKVYIHLLGWLKLEPNIVHLTLSKLDLPIITQNIDSLHQKSGSSNIIELHGNLQTLQCRKCTYKISTFEVFHKIKYSEMELYKLIQCPNCNSYLKPNLVLFGEPISNFHNAVSEIDKCDLLLVIGNSLKVWPANKLVSKAKEQNCEVIIVNSGSEDIFNFYN